MSDDLYERDVLAWSQHQADLLRRLGRGEEVNDVDWTNVAEEIEGVGLSELHSVQDLLNGMLLRVLKVCMLPNNPFCNQWRQEIVRFHGDLMRRFTPSMRQRVSVDDLFGDAVDQFQAGFPGVRLPLNNPFNLDHLLHDSLDVLLSRFEADPP